MNEKAQFLGKITKLRNNGKKLHNAHRIHRFVEIYSKQLYKDEKLRKIFYPKKAQSRDIDDLIAFKSPEHRRQIFDDRIKEYMLRKLYKRRLRVQEKLINVMLKHADCNNDYNYRMNFIDQTIEQQISYFNSTMNMANRQFDVQIDAIMKQIRKNREVMVNKSKRKQNRKMIW